MATSLTMCLKANGLDTDEATVNKVMGAAPMQGASWEQAFAAAQHFGQRITMIIPATLAQVKAYTDRGVPVMIAWNPEGRPWSHASVIFDVTDDGMVYVADPNIPDPEETVRIIPKSEFYGKWYEKWPDYLVRRPAVAIEPEITSDGRQVVASKVAGFYKRRQPSRSPAGPYSDDNPSYSNWADRPRMINDEPFEREAPPRKPVTRTWSGHTPAQQAAENALREAEGQERWRRLGRAAGHMMSLLSKRYPEERAFRGHLPSEPVAMIAFVVGVLKQVEEHSQDSKLGALLKEAYKNLHHLAEGAAKGEADAWWVDVSEDTLKSVGLWAFRGEEAAPKPVEPPAPAPKPIDPPGREYGPQHMAALEQLLAKRPADGFLKSLYAQVKSGKALSEAQAKALRQNFYKMGLRPMADLFRTAGWTVRRRLFPPGYFDPEYAGDVRMRIKKLEADTKAARIKQEAAFEPVWLEMVRLLAEFDPEEYHFRTRGTTLPNPWRVFKTLKEKHSALFHDLDALSRKIDNLRFQIGAPIPTVDDLKRILQKVHTRTASSPLSLRPDYGSRTGTVMEDTFAPVHEVAKYLGLNPEAIYKLIRDHHPDLAMNSTRRPGRLAPVISVKPEDVRKILKMARAASLADRWLGQWP
jgi:hypothetical protein